MVAVKDTFGTELKVGDRILFAYTEPVGIGKGTITRLTESRVYFLWDGSTAETWTVSSRVVKHP